MKQKSKNIILIAIIGLIIIAGITVISVWGFNKELRYSESKKIERWQKISESAAKQSGRTIIPEVRKIVTIQDIAKLTEQYDSVIVAYENEKQNTIKKELLKLKNKEQVKIAVVIGPEGGLEDNDVKLLKEVGANIVTLGNRILRTETVALNILSVIMYELEI